MLSLPCTEHTSELNPVRGIQPPKIYGFFPSFIKYLLTKTCFNVHQSTVVNILSSSYFLLSSQFDFLSVCDDLPQVRSWLSTDQDLVMGGVCPAGRYNLPALC